MHRTPRHYQVDGIDWLTTPNVPTRTSINPVNPSYITYTEVDQATKTLARHILTDAPGAGKSFQSTEAAIELTPDSTHSILIITPAHLVPQWFDFIDDQYPDDTIISFEGSHARKAQSAAVHARWYIASVQSLRSKKFLDMYTTLAIQHHIDCIILDESHYCKNRDSHTSHNVLKLTNPNLIQHVILLTATPVIKEADDLYMQLRICDPFTFHNFDAFLNTYCYFSWTRWGATNVALRKNAPQALSRWMMGRTYKDIGLELPPLISPPPVTHEMISQRRTAYDNIKTYWYTLIDNVKHDSQGQPVLTANSAMEVMHMLRHIISSPEKQSSLISHLHDDPGPYLIAVFYRNSAKELHSYLLEHAGINAQIITGEVPAADRLRIAKDSAHTPNSVVIATIPSITEGCDLSHCNTVYFYEEDFTPGKMYQFLSRVRRHRDTPETTRGGYTIEIVDNHLHIEENPNDRPVIVKYFHADKTIDTHIHAVQTLRAVNVRDLVKVELGV